MAPLQRSVALLVASGSFVSCHAWGYEDVCTAEERRIVVDTVPIASPPRPVSARPPESVAIVGSAPRYPFVEVAFLEAQQVHSYCATRDDIVQELRNVGGEMGCDFVIVHSPNDLTHSDRYGSYTYKGYHASCGVYYGAANRPPVPAARYGEP